MATGIPTIFFFKKEILKQNTVNKIQPVRICYRYMDGDGTTNPGFVRYRDSMSVVQEITGITDSSGVVSISSIQVIETYNLTETACT